MPDQTMTQPENMTIQQAINLALDDAMASDDKVVLIGEDVADREEGGVIGITKGLSTKYGNKRVRSTPISEQAIMGAAIGAAMAGYRPVAEIMLMNFTTVAMDMIVNHAAKLRYMSGGQTNVPLVIRTMTGSGFSLGGQHSDYLESWFAHVAGLKVVAPSNAADAYGLLLSCINDDDPCMFIENLPTYTVSGPAPIRGVAIPLGRAKIVCEGADISVIAHSRMIIEAAAAAKALAAEGIGVELIDLRTIAPWDRDTVIQSVRKTGRALVVHEANRQFGIGGEIAAEISEAVFDRLKAPVSRLGGASSPVPFSKPLESAYAPDRTGIERTIRSMLQFNRA